MTKNLRIRWKIIIPIAIISLIGSIATYYFTSNIYKQSEINAYLNKAKTITTAADGARNFTALQNKHKVFKDSIENVDDFLKTVPIVAAMELARSKAKELDFEFKVPAEQFRNPDNEPDAFEKTMLSRLRAQSKINPDSTDIWEVHTENGKDYLRYFRGVYLTEDCMQCHGDKSLSQKYWGNNKGQDPTGAVMEGMEIGYMKGAFEIKMDMEPVYNKVNEASTKIFGISIAVGFLIIFVALLISNNISRPLNKLQAVSEKISSGDLSEEISFDRGDEIGSLGDSFENLRTKINNVISESKLFTAQVISGELDKQIETENENGAFKELFNGYNSLMNSSNSILDKTSNVMVGNKDGIITYMNANLINMFENNLSDIKKVIPNFEIEKLIGTNIDTFHKNPAHNRSVLENITNKHQAKIRLGSLTFRLSISPIYDQGKKSSYVVVWDDYTEDGYFQSELRNIIENVKAGILDKRLKVEQLGVAFKDVGTSINQMLEAVVEPFNITSNYLENISNGKMPNKLEKDFGGEYDKVRDNINLLISTLTSFIDEMRNMNQKHDEGFISVMMDSSKFKGVYSEMSVGVNTMVKGHIETKKMAINTVNEFGKGNFDADIERLPNEKAFINEALDSVRDNLKNFKSEVQLLIDAAKNGELETRGQAGKFHGDWSELVSGLNSILEAITEPIEESGIILSKMSEGDFRSRMQGNYKGQFGILKDNINQVNESLSSLLIQLQSTINTTAATAAELSATSESMASSSAEQSAQADEVASAVEEMSHTITDNARSSSKTSEVATKNGESAREGGKIVEETINKMKDIASVVSNSASTVGELGESSKEIGEIVSVIDDIAEQTNMLALNAAIEAARAGEQGRGFAVVADEVRKLAERTSEATKRISTMIGGIQVKTDEAVQAMNKGNKEVELGINLADNAGESLNQILSNAKEVLDMINQIAAASEEQSATSEEISKNVVAISQVTSDFSKKVQDVSISAEDLSKLTTGLDSMVSKFKFNNDESKSNNQLDSSNTGSSGRLLN